MTGFDVLKDGVVSVDDHILEPPELWTSRLASKFGDAVPHMTREKVPSVISDGEVWADVWHYEDVDVQCRRTWASVGYLAEDIELEPCTYEDFRPGCYQPDERIADMDVDGVAGAVCFPNQFVRFCGQRFLEASDKELALACVRAYNDALLDEWQHASGGRLAISIVIPLWDAALAAQEVRRTAELGATSVCFSEMPARLGLPSIHSGHWDPWIEACNDTRMVVNMHIGSSSQIMTTSPDAPHGVGTANEYTASSLALSDWVTSGLFVRYPNLRIAFSEGQAGWIPYIASRLDGQYHRDAAFQSLKTTLPEPPSEYIRRHVFSCIYDDRTALRLIDVIGEDNLCFETDYPHQNGTWPNSGKIAHEQTSDLTPELQHKVLRTNAIELYRFPFAA
jgi:predicted TIM-barrel fold metal-dependent hydrolase